MPYLSAIIVLSAVLGLGGCSQNTAGQQDTGAQKPTAPSHTPDSATGNWFPRQGKDKTPVASRSVRVPKALAALDEEPDGAPPSIIRPDEFLRDLRRSEQHTDRTTKWMKSWCKSLEIGADGPMRKNLSRRFRAQWFGDEVKKNARIDVHVFERTPNDQWIDARGFTQNWMSLTQKWTELQRCKIKAWRFRATPNERYAWAQMRFVLEGRGQKEGRVSIRGEFEAYFDLKYSRLLAVAGKRFERLTRARPMFVDVSDEVGVRLHRAKLTEKMVQEDIDGNRLETLGGLAVLDWNRDGRDDLAVWNRRRTFQVFVNDGRGGFDSILNPIPADSVGLFHLYLDIDGNGYPELISTELGGCEDGKAWFRTFEHRGEKLVNLGRVFTFDLECDRYGLLRYQHIAAADIDSDGDLDVVFSGFDNRHSMRKVRNQFQGTDGQRNLVYFNDGSLKFREADASHGFEASRYTYATTFFDYDRDGDQDLYVVNDYGNNQLYLNDGRGRFIEAQDDGLTANGQSMGVTVADLDGDLDFEVYVSNMYSYAGNRIVPLTDDRLSAGTFTELLSLAKGNSAFKRMADGSYRDIAGDLALERGGWAWGQAVFDADNDGRWDVYVVNGNASHRDARAPDY